MKRPKLLNTPVSFLSGVLAVNAFISFTAGTPLRKDTGPEGQHRRKDATEQMKNLTLARTRTQVPGFYSADALTTKLRVPVAEPEFLSL